MLAILGSENSPSCYVSYIYSNKGMENRMGLFMEKLSSKIINFKIPMIGINRKYISESLKSLELLIEKAENN